MELDKVILEIDRLLRSGNARQPVEIDRLEDLFDRLEDFDPSAVEKRLLPYLEGDKNAYSSAKFHAIRILGSTGLGSGSERI